ncbi:MAG: hypothetical protein GC136_06855 [Alphaproteobacteria bacterium]|nr:hypothetical protein [Alphaproteobacteria bacterium]
MAELEPLIRLRKHRVDEKQKILSNLFRDYERLEEEKQKLETSLEKEYQIAQESGEPETVNYYMRYAKDVRERIENIEKGQKLLNTRIALAQDEVREAFSEMKKVEIIHERREEEERKEILKKEADIQDEQTLQRYTAELQSGESE